MPFYFYLAGIAGFERIDFISFYLGLFRFINGFVKGFIFNLYFISSLFGLFHPSKSMPKVCHEHKKKR
jgi:hypothetical protein